MLRRLALTLLFALAGALPLKAAQPAIAGGAMNPPPAVALGAFERFELEPATLAPGLEAHKGNTVALRYFQVDLDERVPKLLAARNALPAGEAPRTLLIRPEIADIRFITGGKRVLLGGFAGKSWALVKLHLLDKASGAVIAEPQFLQGAHSILAGYSLGAADKLMLARLSDQVAAYLSDNMEQPVETPVKKEARKMD